MDKHVKHDVDECDRKVYCFTHKRLEGRDAETAQQIAQERLSLTKG